MNVPLRAHTPQIKKSGNFVKNDATADAPFLWQNRKKLRSKKEKKRKPNSSQHFSLLKYFFFYKFDAQHPPKKTHNFLFVLEPYEGNVAYAILHSVVYSKRKCYKMTRLPSFVVTLLNAVPKKQKSPFYSKFNSKKKKRKKKNTGWYVFTPLF